jgi:retinol-binding protein 3
MKARFHTALIAAASVLQLGMTLAAEGAAQPAASIEIDARTRKDVLDSLAHALETQYAIPEMATQLAATVRAKQKSHAYQNISAAPVLARALTDDLLAVAHDKHLRVIFSFTPVSVPAGPPGTPSPEAIRQMRRLNGLIQKVEILEGNVGYMRVNGVPSLEAAGPAVAASFAFVHNTDALIIDNRGNPGGDPNTVALYVSYLSEGTPFVVNTFHWRAGNRIQEFRTTELGELSYGAHKPVFVLTSPLTFSGGEELAYDLQVLKRATIVGEVTGGGANPGGPVSLGHQFLVNMPSGQGINPRTQSNWEGVGVKPDVPVSTANALRKAHELAVERLAAAAPDAPARSMLDAVSMQLQSLDEADSGTHQRLSNSEIVGTYALEAGPGAPVTILEDGGRLLQRVSGFPDATLAYLNGNRYRPAGFPDSYVTSFRVHGDKTELLLVVPFGPPTIRAKQ